MYERVLRAAAVLIASLLPLPLAAQAPCAPLGVEVALCGQGTAWAEARPVEIDHEEGVIAYEAPPLYLEASTDWVPASAARTLAQALAFLESALAEEAAEDGAPPPELLLREGIETAHVTGSLGIYTEDFDGEAVLLAVLLVADGPGWLTLFLSSDDDMAAAPFEQQARLLAELLRLAPEG